MRRYGALFFCWIITNTDLVFGIIIHYICINQIILAMSRELTEFSTLIDEQLEIAGNDHEGFWAYLLSLFK